MSNPVTRAFFVGRAFAQVLNEKVEETVTNALSEFGKFDAEQRENLREFAQEVMTRAEREMSQTTGTTTTNFTSNGSQPGTQPGSKPVDLQETIDNLRAEIAQLRAAVAAHRQSSQK